MQLFRKSGDELIIVYKPTETIEVGETLKVDEGGRGIIVQVIESSLLDLPGILEEVVRSEITEHDSRRIGGSDYAQYSSRIRNMRFARCKIRKEISDGKIGDWTGYSPSRDAKVTRLDEDELLTEIRGNDSGWKHKFPLGESSSSKTISISAHDLQGLTLIVGRKGMGKSHVAKSLLLGLLANGAHCVVFDINDEYSRLGYEADGKSHPIFGQAIVIRRPGTDLKFTLDYMGQEVFLKVLEAVGVAEASLYQVRDTWEQLQQNSKLSFAGIIDEVNHIQDGRIRGSLQRRMKFLQGAALITDSATETATLEGILTSDKSGQKTGRALIVSLKGLDRTVVRATVQTLLSRLQGLLEKKVLRPMFLFAEEAHLYLTETDWVEEVTRIRHLGIFQIYMTNTPTRVPNLIVRQVDNLLLFHLDLEEDSHHVAPASGMDEASVVLVARALPARKFVVVGTVTDDFPVQLSTTELPTVAAGETILRFTER